MNSIYQQRPWLRLYPDWVPHDIDAEAATAIGDFLKTAKRIPEAPAIFYFDEAISYGDVDGWSDSLAAAFHDMGLRSGDRIIVDLQNIPQFLIGAYAAWKIGAIVVPVNPMYKETELAYFCMDSGAKIFLTLDEIARNLNLSFLNGTRIENIITTSALDFLNPDSPLPEILKSCTKSAVQGCRDLRELLDEYKGKRVDVHQSTPDSVAYLTYTSGTTGQPKGAMNTQGNIAFSARVYKMMMRMDSTDVVLGVAPLFHVTGEVAHTAVAALVGIPVVLSYRFDARETLRLIEHWKATMTVASITVYIAWMNTPEIRQRDLSSFCKAYSGGAPVSSAQVDQFHALTGCYLHNVYGMTETSSPSHIVPLGTKAPVDPDTGALSVGLPVPNAVSKICDSDDCLHELSPNEIGEIVNRGPMIIAGYWQRPEETSHAIKEGWLYTGDVGKMDENGWFYVVDRKKDLIIASGFKVWPRDVEDVIYQHPGVKETAVIGVPDEYRGETVKAFVALKPGFETSVTPEEIVIFCKSRMAAYKYPRVVEFVPEIPKTLTGKFLRRALRK
ncbi:class I adenylate-forming enzyme family protein [Desulfomonile tiedjei]|uniref:Acyl-CoA synthetase (AMP-forming)/AMP-acid ligase II n=1 Tax=Desulfomonile tiedjei (strain ATCC 49306 / DSM 6799 / DCB-1) TaxID=706587 RepID=I4C566_DESTA|nr:AMP-binding protein [Desulfomonile tiedjei]AFM24707.1 acyl-CoA synthetase (AMP-forming)/AMP-acid ligase II [Desulfomonile tiedjei DSM 6799]